MNRHQPMNHHNSTNNQPTHNHSMNNRQSAFNPVQAVRSFLSIQISVWWVCLLAIAACAIICAINNVTSPATLPAIEPAPAAVGTVASDEWFTSGLRQVIDDWDNAAGQYAWITGPLKDRGIQPDDVARFCEFWANHPATMDSSVATAENPTTPQ